MAKESITPPSPINLNNGQIQLFETFLQYGDLAKAKIVFMGREEGLAGDYFHGMHLTATAKYHLAEDARRLLLTDPIFKSNRVFVNETNSNDGWYINDSECLKHAQWIKLFGSGYIKSTASEPIVIQLQARMFWLLQGNNRSTNYKSITSQNFSTCPYLHTLNNAAMIDYFPLPNLNVKTFPYQNYISRTNYEARYLNVNTTTERYRILKNIYDKYPINVTIAYAGEDNGFRLLRFFQSLGFCFGVPLYTNKVNPTYAAYISPSPKPKMFLIGSHREKDQKVILTPFFSTRYTIKKEDIDVISTWI